MGEDTNIRMQGFSTVKLTLSMVVEKGEGNELVVTSIMPSLSASDK